MKRLLLIFILTLNLSGCVDTFKNLGDPTNLIGIIYGFGLHNSSPENKPELLYSDIPASITEGDIFRINFRISGTIQENKEIIITSDNSALTINDNDQISLVFQTNNSTIEQQVSLKAKADENVISEKINLKIHSDWFDEQNFIINISDNSQQTILLTASDSIAEGQAINASIQLSRKPDADITVKITSDNNKLLTTNVQNLTFTPDNYNIPQSLQVQAVENELYLFDKVATLSFQATSGEILKKEFTVLSNNIEYRDLSAGQDSNSGYTPDIILYNGKILVVSRNNSNFDKASLFHCDIDGKNCLHKDLSTEEGEDSGYYPLVETFQNKLLLVTRNGDNDKKPSLFYCNIDGSNCTHKDISAGQGGRSANSPDIIIDRVNQKLLVVTQDASNDTKPSLFRCDLDGNNCVYRDISAGQDSRCGYDPVITIDYLHSKILVVTRSTGKVRLFRCELDGTDCHYSLVAGINGRYPALAIDDLQSKLIIAVTNFDNEREINIFSCELDGTNCIQKDIFNGQNFSSGSGYEPSIAIDNKNSFLHIVSRNNANNNQLGYYRCDSYTYECVFKNISQAQGDNTGKYPKIIIDEINSKVLITTMNGSNDNKPALYRFPINFIE